MRAYLAAMEIYGYYTDANYDENKIILRILKLIEGFHASIKLILINIIVCLSLH